MNLDKVSKTISYLLRHNPEDLKMDKNGYVIVNELLIKVGISKKELDWVVENNDKKRFAYSEDGSKIRASQGHSIDVHIDMKAIRPPRELYHGTKKENLDSILKTGLNKMKRQHVHMTDKEDVAYSVGKRYSGRKEPIILVINSGKMYADGFKFFLSDNGVWLTDNVPAKYIEWKE